MTPLTPEILLNRGYREDVDINDHGNTVSDFHKNGTTVRQCKHDPTLFEVNGEEIEYLEELHRIEYEQANKTL